MPSTDHKSNKFGVPGNNLSPTLGAKTPRNVYTLLDQVSALFAYKFGPLPFYLLSGLEHANFHRRSTKSSRDVLSKSSNILNEIPIRDNNNRASRKQINRTISTHV